ncbi:alpha/beta fold hydrolase [Thiomonas bhubaneswarensis]|uniref:Alpha/beta hydrolase family n=1 Tax=Thiomonas bhubaneswarensis TaxID=339866 RepID=A0A0K6I7H5_9BURK|nr:alpha/beta fold hydrolase [Thiomonas bhubaneswarensis]CUA99051.1 Alpha/beta hydrolase family [Thiomonas bhubaneswarensis]
MRETTLTFGAHDDLLGTVTFPSAQTSSNPPIGVLLFNAGVIHRVGAHRVNVKLARALAADGVASLRFDLHGMGDSLRADGQLSYKEQVVADLRAAMDLLQNHTGAQHFALVGFCSGALPSYWSAQVDPRVSVIVLYDALSYATPWSVLRYLGLRLMRHGFGPRAWWKWLQLGLRGVGAVGHKIVGRLTRSRPTAPSPSGGAESDDDQSIDRLTLGRGLLALAERGVGVMVLSAGTDFSAVNYADQLRQTLGLRGVDHARLLFAHLHDIDHAVTTRVAQQQWVEAVRGGLLQLAPVSPAVAPSS